MSSGNRIKQNWLSLILLLVLGGLAGSLIGELLVYYIPSLKILAISRSVGLPAFNLDLQVFSMTFGFMFNISIFTIVGFIMALIAYRKI